MIPMDDQSRVEAVKRELLEAGVHLDRARCEAGKWRLRVCHRLGCTALESDTLHGLVLDAMLLVAALQASR